MGVFSAIEFVPVKSAKVLVTCDTPVDTVLNDLAHLLATWCNMLEPAQFNIMCRDLSALSQLSGSVSFPSSLPQE